jgi:MFS family permease
VLVFPKLFFPAADPATATLASLATFGIAFLARPIGSALFGHFGDRIGRKTTLVMALATMGVSTVSIGVLPTTIDRHCCAAAAGALPVWAGAGAGRRVGRRGAAGD